MNPEDFIFISKIRSFFNQDTVTVFIGIFNFCTLLVAVYASKQISLLAEQNKYSVHKDKVEYLGRFQSLIEDLQKFHQNKVKINNPVLELEDYFISELEFQAGPKRDIFIAWMTAFEDEDTKQEAYNLANKLELFAMAIAEDKILKDVRNVISRSFCELVETNPAVYIQSRIPGGPNTNLRYENTIKLRKDFIKEVGSRKERNKLEKEYLAQYNWVLRKSKNQTD